MELQEESIMARPRKGTTKKFPEGLYEKKRKGETKVTSWIFYRIDGTSKSFRDLKLAKTLAFQYNRTYRIDKELIHGIYKDSREATKDHKMSKPLGAFMPEMFERLCDEKQWKSGTLKTRKQQFKIILEYFKDIPCKDVALCDVNEFLTRYDTKDDANSYNRYLYVLKEVFAICVDQDFLDKSPAAVKKRKTIKRISSVERTRLNYDDFRRIHELAGKKGEIWMQVAMELAMQTSQGVNEVANMKYKDVEDEHLKIIRKKTETNEASHVKIPVNKEIGKIITNSRADDVLSPYIVHRKRLRRYSGRSLGEGITHETQLPSIKISRRLSALRDELGIQAHLSKDKRSGFHDIRALSIHWQKSNGYESKVRAAQADDVTNLLYQEGHIEWNFADDVIIDWKRSN
jgi:hypothetical protein